MTGKPELRPGAFFDRDGVINVDCGYLHSPDQFTLVRGAAEALRKCREAGYLIFVVTNQSGVARGYYDEIAVRNLHDYMRARLAEDGASIDDLRYCPHHIEGTAEAYARECSWRKPGPGMILDIATHWPVDLTRSFLVGDKESDMAAAHAAGVAGHLFTGGDLASFVKPILDANTAPPFPRKI